MTPGAEGKIVLPCRFQATCTDSPGGGAVPPPDAGDEQCNIPLTDLFLNDDIDWADDEALIAMEDWAPLSEGPHTRTRNRFLTSPSRPILDDAPVEPNRPVTRSKGRHGASRAERREARTAAVRAHAEALAAAGTDVTEATVANGALALEPVAGSSATNAAVSADADADALVPLDATADASAVPPALDVPAPPALGGVMTCAQVCQLHAQVQAHAQLLLQTVAIAGQRDVSNLVCKRWGWDVAAAKDESSEMRQQQGKEASAAYSMLTEWRNLSDSLQQQRSGDAQPPLPLSTKLLHAVPVDTQQADAQTTLDALQQGWRPVVLDDSVPSIAHVPWLVDLEPLLGDMGFDVQQQEGQQPAIVHEVRKLSQSP